MTGIGLSLISMEIYFPQITQIFSQITLMELNNLRDLREIN